MTEPITLQSIDAKLAAIDKQIQRNLESIRVTQDLLIRGRLIKANVTTAELNEAHDAAANHADVCFNDADRRKRIQQSICAVALSDCIPGMKHALYRSICLL